MILNYDMFFSFFECHLDSRYDSGTSYMMLIFLADIDECASENTYNCSGIAEHIVCGNLPGSYDCVCDVGYLWNATLDICEGTEQPSTKKLEIKTGDTV